MAVSSITYTEGAGSFLHADERTISSVARKDQYVQHGQPAYPTYTVTRTQSIATTADHVLVINADGTNYTRLLSYRVALSDDRPAADSIANIQLLRVSTLGTGGTAITPSPHDTADTYAGTVQADPTAKGTEAAIIHDRYLYIPTAFSASVEGLTWQVGPYEKPIVFGTGTGAGLAFKVVTGIASCTLNFHATFVVTSFL